MNRAYEQEEEDSQL